MFSPLAKSARLLSVLVLMSGLFACGGSTLTVAPEQATMKKEGIMSMSVEWVKDKKTKYDIRMVIRNEAKTPIIVKLGEMQCYRGEHQGILRHTFFNTGERTIDFAIGQSKVFQMVCDTHDKASGPFRIIFGRVYDNPAYDGATLGKVISENVEWKANDAG